MSEVSFPCRQLKGCSGGVLRFDYVLVVAFVSGRPVVIVGLFVCIGDTIIVTYINRTLINKRYYIHTYIHTYTEGSTDIHTYIRTYINLRSRTQTGLLLRG